MNEWLQENLTAAAVGVIVALILTFDRLTSAVASILDRFSLGGFRKWEIRRAEAVLDRRDRQTSLRILAMRANELEKLAEHVEQILAAVTPNHGASMSDKVNAIDAKLDRLLTALDVLDARVDDIDERVRMME
jgi:hypothetical protein